MELPAIFYPSRVRLSLLLFLSLLFVAGGVFAIMHQQYLVGVLNIAFFGLCSIIFALCLSRKAAYLRLDQDGFTYCSLYRKSKTAWTDVKEFGVTRIALNTVVAMNYVDDYHRQQKLRRVNTRLVGFEGALPDNYGFKPQELSDLLNRVKKECVNRRSTY